MNRNNAPYRKRISAWTNPWLIGIGVGFLLLGLPMVLWLMTYHSDIAVQMFVITWLSLTFFVLLMAKGSLNDPRYYVDRKKLQETKRDLAVQRTRASAGFLKKEIEVLERGEKTPVLDVWKIDPQLSRRHLFFLSIQDCLLDPQIRELHIRIQVDDLRNSDAGPSVSEKELVNHIADFFKTIVRDPYLMQLKKFFERIVLQVDALREDQHHVDRPYPVASLLVEYSRLESMTHLPSFDGQRLVEGSDLRWNGLNEIQPHRLFESSSSHGSK